LLTFGDVKVSAIYQVFSWMVVGGYVLMLVYFVYTQYRFGGALPVDFDNDITRDRVVKTVVAYVGLIVVAFLTAYFVPSQVRTVQLGVVPIAVLLYMPPVDASGTVLFGSQAFTELLRQLFVVAHGEELLRAMGSLIFAAVLHGNRSLRGFLPSNCGSKLTSGMVMALAFMNGIWTAYHGMRATPVLAVLVGIFLCGVVLIWLLLSTGCVLLVIACHGFYNFTVQLLQGNLATLPAAASLVLIFVPMMVHCSSLRSSKMKGLEEL